METDIDTNLRKQGVVSNLDGAAVIKYRRQGCQRIVVLSSAIHPQRWHLPS